MTKLLTFVLLMNLLATMSRSAATPAPATLAEEAETRGQFETAADLWSRVAAEHERDKQYVQQTDALIHLAGAQQALGLYRAASETMEKAVAVAERTGDADSLLRARIFAATICTCTHRQAWAERNLQSSIEEAGQKNDARWLALAWHSLASLQAQTGKIEEALASFETAAKLAGESSNPALQTKALANGAVVARQAGKMNVARDWNKQAGEAAGKLPSNHETTMQILRVAQTFCDLGDWDAAERAGKEALRAAETLGNARSQSLALGLLGQVAEKRSNWDRALELTRQARFTAQQQQMPDALYRWEWQIGRIHRAQGNLTEATAAYRRAHEALRPVREDWASGCRAGRASYRETVGAVYWELADLLLQQADRTTDAKAEQETLRQARETIEQFKHAEMQDFLRDECAQQPRLRTADVDRVANGTAVIYLLPFADRLELLLGFADGLERVKSSVRGKDLEETVQSFRQNLEKRTTNQYLKQSQQLYQWIIEPIKTRLAGRKTDTLLFVPDGYMRTIPMGALHDGSRFLVEQYAIAVSPGLTLVETRPLSREGTRMLSAGLSVKVENYPSLPHVKTELGGIKSVWGGDQLLDSDFAVEQLRKRLAENQYQMVHIASHGEFRGDLGESFIMTQDGKLTFDQLEAMLRPGQFRGRPLELLTLSACQTAAGDDRAAMGLAGVAIKAGARSTLATLWFVHDASTATLMSRFYKSLREDVRISKAGALQKAQVQLLQDARYEHPGYWAPYLIVGNWL
jgi:CHAT domain-containing protein